MIDIRVQGFLHDCKTLDPVFLLIKTEDMKQNIARYLLIFILLTGCKGVIDKQPDEPVWWKETVFYQIYMPSFQDSSGSGYSDFKGMTTRLNYLEALGVKGIWLTPFQKSPKVDNGYDVADYYSVDPMYGSMNDFKKFLAEAHSRGIKVIMDMVVNHTSTDAYWFQQSRLSKDNPYRDYYVWRDEPNNWESFFGGPAWTRDTLTGQYYYHKFDVRMADLNWTNPEVVREIQEVLRFWLDMGIDGFRLDVINFLLTDGILEDNPMENGNQIHKYDVDQPGVKDAMRLIRETVNEYDDRFIVGEIGSADLDVLQRYQAPDMMDVVFNFNFGSIPAFSVEDIFNELVEMEEKLHDFPTLFFGSHDMPRPMNRLAEGCPKRAEALAALILTAKGVPFIYYGEEIGMHNIKAQSIDDIIDVQGRTQYFLALEAGKTPEEALREINRHNRDRSRSPMQWDDSPNAGFTTGKPWIGVHENYRKVNAALVEQQENSILNRYRKLINLRNSEEVLQYGAYTSLERLTDEAIRFTRTLNEEHITVVINFGDLIAVELPANAKLLMGTGELGANEYVIFRHAD